MYQLLIVDDQPDLVDDLAENLPWDTVGIGVVHRAYSAQEALDIVAAHPVDVVVTDIRMPGLSGLDLIERIRTSWSKIRCILLSGYDDFEYAKRALQHKANDYLLKPAEDAELLEAVARAVGDIEAQWNEIASYRNAVQSVKENLPIVRAHLLADLLSGRRIGHEELREKLELLELPFPIESSCCLLLLRLEDHFHTYNGTDLSLMEYAVANMAEEIFGDAYRLWHKKDDHEYMVFLLAPKEASGGDADSQEPIELKASQLQHYIKLYLKGTASALVSRFGRFPDDVPSLYDGSVLAFRQQIGGERELLLSMSDAPPREPPNSLTQLNEPPTINHLLEAGRWDALEKKLDAVFEELETRFGHSHEHILETYFLIVGAFASSIHKSKRWMADVLGDEFERVASGAQFHTIQQLREWTERIARNYRSAMASESQDSRSGIVRQVQEYVHEHLGEASLQSIAERVHLNPSYLSKVYKLETGEGVSDYLFRLKMEQAAHKLRTTHEKIYEIAAGLGYLKTSYFIKVFKEKYGLTPQEYRDTRG